MRGRVPYKGKFVKADNIPIGEPIMLTADEWIEREKADTRRWMLMWWLLFPVVIAPIILGMGWAFGRPMWPDNVASALTYAIMFPVLYSVPELINSRRTRSKGVYTGLFDHGVLVRGFGLAKGDFIPYALIGDFRFEKRWFGKALTMDITGFEGPTAVNRERIFEGDGLDMLRRMIIRSPEDEEPPELHVYGGRASKLRSIQRSSVETDTKKD